MSLLENFQAAYENIDGCLVKISERNFGIYDYGEDLNLPCEITLDGSNRDVFRVVNNDQIEINFIPTDHCLFDNTNPKKCDCVLFTDFDFLFVEIKKPTSKKQRSERKKDAYQQLESTINEFEGKRIFDEIKLTKEAIVCLLGHKTIPTTLSENWDKRKYFEDKFGVILKEGSFKEY